MFELSKEAMQTLTLARMKREADRLIAGDADLRAKWDYVKNTDTGINIWLVEDKWMFWVVPEDVDNHDRYFALDRFSEFVEVCYFLGKKVMGEEYDAGPNDVSCKPEAKRILSQVFTTFARRATNNSGR